MFHTVVDCKKVNICDCNYVVITNFIMLWLQISLDTLVPNSRDRQGKLWLPKKQKTALKTTLQ